MRPRFSIVCVGVLTPYAVRIQPSFGVLEMCQISGALDSTEQENPVHHMFVCLFFHNKQKGNNIYTQSSMPQPGEIECREESKKQGARSRRKQVCVFFQPILLLFNIFVFFSGFQQKNPSLLFLGGKTFLLKHLIMHYAFTQQTGLLYGAVICTNTDLYCIRGPSVTLNFIFLFKPTRLKHLHVVWKMGGGKK